MHTRTEDHLLSGTHQTRRQLPSQTLRLSPRPACHVRISCTPLPASLGRGCALHCLGAQAWCAGDGPQPQVQMQEGVSKAGPGGAFGDMNPSSYYLTRKEHTWPQVWALGGAVRVLKPQPPLKFWEHISASDHWLDGPALWRNFWEVFIQNSKLQLWGFKVGHFKFCGVLNTSVKYFFNCI